MGGIDVVVITVVGGIPPYSIPFCKFNNAGGIGPRPLARIVIFGWLLLLPILYYGLNGCVDLRV